MRSKLYPSNQTTIGLVVFSTLHIKCKMHNINHEGLRRGSNGAKDNSKRWKNFEKIGAISQATTENKHHNQK